MPLGHAQVLAKLKWEVACKRQTPRHQPDGKAGEARSS